MSEPTITYLGPADEADTGDRKMVEVKRYWVPHNTLADQSGWHQDDSEVVQAWAFDRVTAERDALQQRLNAADQRIDELERDKARLDALESNCWDVRYDSNPNGDAGDSSISIEIVGHWMDKPTERVIGEDYSENLRAAIDQAMKAPAYPPARPEYPEIDEALEAAAIQ